MKKIGWIGTGVMGASMIKHLLNAGYTVYVNNRTKSKADEVVQLGAIWVDSPVELTTHCEVIFTMLGYPSDVEAIYLNPQTGLISQGNKDLILVDLTTSSPTLAADLAQQASDKGIHLLDSPVTGGDVGAKNGTLSIMVGGDEAIYQQISSLLDTFSSKHVYYGAAGKGQHAKLANQISIAASLIGVCESLAYANAAGLNLEAMLETIGKGSAGSWSTVNYGPRILQGDYKPGFYIHHFIKDMKLCLEECAKMNLNLPGLSLVHDLYESLAEDSKYRDGIHALYEYYKK